MNQENQTQRPVGIRPLYPDGRQFTDPNAAKYALIIDDTEHLISASQATLLLRGLLREARVEVL